MSEQENKTKEEKAGIGGYISLIFAIVFFSGVLFAAGGMVTSALEVFFTISAALLARRLWLLRRGKRKF